jgi:hypothetical protein
MMETNAGRRTRLLWIVIVGLLLTLTGVILALVSVTVIPRGEGPRATAFVGGGAAEASGVTLRIGDYTILADNPQYAGTPMDIVQPVCPDTDGMTSGGKITRDLLPVRVVPIGFARCMIKSEKVELDQGRLILQVENIGVIQATLVGQDAKSLALSEVDAQVQKTRQEIWTEIGVLLLLASGPGLVIGALVPLLLQSRKANAGVANSPEGLPAEGGRQPPAGRP